MPPDPFTNPIAALTHHPVLTREAEAALIATMRAGVEAQKASNQANPSASPEALQRIRSGIEARATLVRHNLRLVVAMAKRYQRVAGDHLSLEDLISLGTLGLLHGIDRFDPRKAGKLSTYVTWWVRQAITRGIMDEGRLIALPIHLHERLATHRRAHAQLTQQLGREPTSDEVTSALGWSPAKAASVAAELHDAGSLNVRAGQDDDSSELGELLPDTRYDPEEQALAGTLRSDIAQAMSQVLTERERQFVRLHFGFDTGQKVTLDVIGQQAGLTRERVRQVIAGALEKLRADPMLQAYAALLTNR
jgi:RNA polymerase sigma factor (sigma-70 family)